MQSPDPIQKEWGISPELLQGNRDALISVLPHDVVELVDEIVADTGATSELVLAMVLGTSAIGVQCVYDIQPPHMNMKPIPASLFVIGIAGSTRRKSAVLNLLTEAYVEYQQSEALSEVHDTVQNARLRGWKADRQQIVEEIEAHYKDAQKVWAIEQGEDTGLHLHVILFYSSESNHDEYIAKQIGEYWENVVTDGKGDYWNSNDGKRKKGYEEKGHGIGVGQINWNDLAKRDALRINLMYLAKTEQYLMIKVADGIHTFGMGQMPTKAKSGRPRIK